MKLYKLEKAYKALQHRLNIASESIKRLEETNQKLRERITLLEAKNTQLIEQSTLRTQIIDNRIADVNKTNNEYLEEIMKLRAKLNAM